MKTKASVLTIRVPFDLKHRIEKMADRQGLSINQLALYTFTKELEEMESTEYFAHRWKNKPKDKILKDFDNVMSKIGSRKKLPEWDKLDEIVR